MRLEGKIALGLAAFWSIGATGPTEVAVRADLPVASPLVLDLPVVSALAADLCRSVEAGLSPEYYRFPMVSTKRVPGTGTATGIGAVDFSESPYGIALSSDGSYRLDFRLSFERLGEPRGGTYVVWTTTTTLDEVHLAGELTDLARFTGTVEWNKFLVVVTLEPTFDPDATLWTGPVVIRGMSRSGMMHTMAGHGPFQQENCAAYGYE